MSVIAVADLDPRQLLAPARPGLGGRPMVSGVARQPDHDRGAPSQARTSRRCDGSSDCLL